MCNEFRKNRAHFLANVAVVGVIAVATSACSNGLARFDEGILTGSVANPAGGPNGGAVNGQPIGLGGPQTLNPRQPNYPQPNTAAIIAAETANPFPSQYPVVDQTYTNSVGNGGYVQHVQPQVATLAPNAGVSNGALRPAQSVGLVGRVVQPRQSLGSRLANLIPGRGRRATQPLPAPVYPQPQPVVAGKSLGVTQPMPQPINPALTTGAVTQPNLAQRIAKQPLALLRRDRLSQPAQPQIGSTNLTRQAMPQPLTAKATDRLTQPQPQALPQPVAKLKSQQLDKTVTGAIPQPSANTTRTHQGWSTAGGTAITVRPGETVYNISRRYGVPPQSLLAVNGMNKASDLREGRRIIIPTYQFSRQAGVSAPDASSDVRAASSSTGFRTRLPDVVAVPRFTPGRAVGSLQPVQTAKVSVRQPLPAPVQPKPYVRPKAVQSKSKTAVGGVYKVASGDSLSAIARRNGVTTNGLMRANGLSNANIRIGQSLIIPGVNQKSITKKPTQIASARPKTVQPVIKKRKNDEFGVDTMTTGSTKPRNVDPIITGSKRTVSPDTSGISNLRWPVRGRVLHSFGETVNGKRNDGIDISVPEGTSVKAAENGVVLYSGSELEGFGNLVLLKHGNGLVTAYAHNSSLAVKRGQKVSRGQTIARAGRSGGAEVPKLHFEVRRNSTPVNPIKYLGG